MISGNAEFDDDDANFTIIDDVAPLGIDPNVDDHGNSLATATHVAEDRWHVDSSNSLGSGLLPFSIFWVASVRVILVKDRTCPSSGENPNADYPTLPQPIAELYNSAGQLIATLPATSLRRAGHSSTRPRGTELNYLLSGKAATTTLAVLCAG